MKRKIIIFTILITSIITGQQNYFDLTSRSKSEEFFVKGYYYYNNMAYSQAVDFFRKSLEAMPLNWNVRYWLGKAYLMAGYKELAISEWETALKHSNNIFIAQKLQQLYSSNFVYDVKVEESLVFLKYFYSLPGVSAIESDNSKFYISNFVNNTIEIRDKNFKLIDQIKVNKPMDIDITDNFIIVASFEDNKIYFYDKNNLNILYSIGGFGIGKENLSGPSGIYFSTTTKNLFIADTGNNKIKVFRIGKEPVFLMEFGERGEGAGEFLLPTDVIEYKETIIVADKKNSRLQVFDKSGNFIYSYGQDELSSPIKLKIYDNNLYVLDEYKGIFITNPEEKNFKLVKGLDNDIQKPIGFHKDSNGIFYISDFFTNKISAYINERFKLSSLKVDALFTFNTAYPTITIKTRVQDLKGKDIDGLKNDNFKLYQEGEEIKNKKVFIYKPDSDKISAIFLVNSSSNMKQYSKDINEYIKKLMETSKPLDRFGLISYNDAINIKPFTSQKLTLQEYFSEISYKDTNKSLDTALYQAITKNLNNDFNNTIIIFDDGKNDSYNNYTPEVLATYAKNNGVSIYVMAVSEGPSTGHLKYLANETNGQYIEFYRSNQIYNLLKIVRNNPTIYYIIVYNSVLYSPANKYHWLNIDIKVNYKNLYGVEKTGFYIP
ncbi:MAG TPA: VWA domain-containing protein [Spirochaetota bacterium]|nr:VWA domain-containing protein [Spirochaetota bacterium]HOM37529.1 VWA domain-containing protein [Spirochaetota bacterium]HPQ49499.1 VWA domain-containing protein [Spirochaetota bacterium]